MPQSLESWPDPIKTSEFSSKLLHSLKCFMESCYPKCNTQLQPVFSDSEVHMNHLESSEKKNLIQYVWVGPESLHFQPAPVRGDAAGGILLPG